MTRWQGELVGRGRTADVFAAGADRVWRVYRDGRDARTEADVMRHLAAHGYPVPRVHDVDGPGLLLDRVEGPTLTESVQRRPWRARAAGRLLDDLLERLTDVPVPSGLPRPFGSGAHLLHLDLHPGNVLLGAGGPVVIDWANASCGPLGPDRAQSWLVTASSEVDVPRGLRGPVRAMQGVLVRPLLARDDEAARAARRWLPEVARRRLTDPNVTDPERERIRALVPSVDDRPA